MLADRPRRMRLTVEVEVVSHDESRAQTRCGYCPLSYGSHCLAFDQQRDEVKEWRRPGDYGSDWVRLDECVAAEAETARADEVFRLRKDL